jgi:uncharacterized protein YceK
MKPLYGVLILLVAAGCGTTGNLFSDRPAYFGGVAGDWDSFDQYAKEPAAHSFFSDFFWGTYLALDVPLSAVGDTLTLPIVWLATPETPSPPVNFTWGTGDKAGLAP